MQNTKVSIIGTGNVGSTLAYTLSIQNICSQIVLKDIKEEHTKGISLDISQSTMTNDNQTNIIFAKEYKEIANSNIVVITAGSPRLDGMSRSDLLQINAKIMKEIVKEVVKYAPNSIIIVVSNPLDAMVFYAFEQSNFPRNRVLGMAGILDSARFAYYINEKRENCSERIEALVIGEHGDSMLPLENYSKIGQKTLNEIFSRDELDDIFFKTKKGGAEIVSYLKNSSAYFAPAHSTSLMIKSILNNSKNIYPCSCILKGEYGHNNIAIGVPLVLGINGVEKIIELELNEKQKKLFDESANLIEKQINSINKDLI